MQLSKGQKIIPEVKAQQSTSVKHQALTFQISHWNQLRLKRVAARGEETARKRAGRAPADVPTPFQT